MKTTTKISGAVAALGAGALTVGLLGFGSGVGASFSDQASGNAKISVGTFACTLSSSDPAVTISPNKHSATVDLGAIQGSSADSRTAPLTVTNSGGVALTTSWTETTSGSIAGHPEINAEPVAANTLLFPGDAQTANIGFSWTELNNADQGLSGTATYTVQCSDGSLPTGLSDGSQDGGRVGADSQHVYLNLPAGVPSTAGAAVTIESAGSSLPTAEPSFTTDAYNAGSPRLAIGLSNGKYVFKYPAASGLPYTWEYPGAPNAGYGDWAGVQAYVASNHLTVTSAFIVADTDQTAPVTDTIGQISYGTFQFPAAP